MSGEGRRQYSTELAGTLEPSSPPSKTRRVTSRTRRVTSRSVASGYWKLDAGRTPFKRELCSWAALRDFVRFVFWLLAGILVDLHLELLDDRFPTCFNLLQWAWLFIAASGIIVAVYVNNWWMLGFCTGGAVCLLQRDLVNHRRWHCVNEYLRLAYEIQQRFAQCLGPIVALWCSLTSRALDRAIGRVSANADIKHLNTWQGWFAWQGWCHLFFGRRWTDLLGIESARGPAHKSLSL